MSEEKEAIKEIKNKFEYLKNSSIPDYNLIFAIEKVLNLIDKLQKENEELKDKLTPRPDRPIPLEYQTIIYVDKRGYISKDKIRNKIKELEKENEKYFAENGFVPSYIYTITVNNKIIFILQELLGDDNID